MLVKFKIYTMKKILLVLLCVPLMFSSCKKDKKSDIKSKFMSSCMSDSTPNISKADQKAYCECVLESIFEKSGRSIDDLEKMGEAKVKAIAIGYAFDCLHLIQPDFNKQLKDLQQNLQQIEKIQ